MTINYDRRSANIPDREYPQWSEFRTFVRDGSFSTGHTFTAYGSRYASRDQNVSDVLGRSGFMFCKVCPSCKKLGSEPILVDAQCHMVPISDHGVGDAEFVRFGDWSVVCCDVCKSNTRFGGWHDDDMLCRPMDTVFKDGSRCWSRRDDFVTIFRSQPRQSDGQLIWRMNEDESSVARESLRNLKHSSRSTDTVIEKILDLSFIYGIRQNDKVRTRTHAAKETLASL